MVYALLTCQPYHCHVDIAQREVVHGKVWCDLHCHGGDYDGVVPELGIVQDVGQADEGHVLGDEGEREETGFCDPKQCSWSFPGNGGVVQLALLVCCLRLVCDR